MPPISVFEITESSAVTNFRGATRFLQAMRLLGVQIMLDDFGSGPELLFTYLKNLPIDYLKIDGALVRDIADSAFDLAILKAIQAVAREIGIPVVGRTCPVPGRPRPADRHRDEYAQGYCAARTRAMDESAKPSTKNP